MSQEHPLKIFVGFAVLPQRYAGFNDALERLNCDLNNVVTDSDWFSKRKLNSLTIVLSMVDAEAPPVIARGYRGQDQRNPFVRIEIDHKIIAMNLDNAQEIYKYLLLVCSRGLTYAAKKIQLDPSFLTNVSELTYVA